MVAPKIFQVSRHRATDRTRQIFGHSEGRQITHRGLEHLATHLYAESDSELNGWRRMVPELARLEKEVNSMNCLDLSSASFIVDGTKDFVIELENHSYTCDTET